MLSSDAMGRWSRVWGGVFLTVVIGAGAVGAWSWLVGKPGGELATSLARRGRVLVLAPQREVAQLPRSPGTELVAVGEHRAAVAALAADEAATWLTDHRFAHVIQPVGDPDAGGQRYGALGAALADYRSVPGLSGQYLSRRTALYSVDDLASMPDTFGPVMAEVARRMLAGAPPPHVQSFPPLLRQVQSVEVMVLLRSGPRNRLWRSARGSSFARAFLTAVRVARQRWHERQQAMGGPLVDSLSDLTVEIALLRDDGQIGTREAGFVDRVVSIDHGIAYERKGSWRYLLPEATAKQGGGRASVALSQLLEDGGLAADAFRTADIRVRRIVVQSVGVSPAAVATDTLGEAPFPDEILVR